MASQKKGYPNKYLDRLTTETKARLLDLTTALKNGEISLEFYGQEFQRVMAGQMALSYMMGHKSENLGAKSQVLLSNLIGKQFDFLKGFIGALAGAFLRFGGIPSENGTVFGDDVNDKVPWRAFENRAGMYASAVVEPYWQGDAVKVDKFNLERDLPFPALPGDGTSQCGQHCKCAWHTVTLGKLENGNFNCYWVMNELAEHCQTCKERGAAWNPLRIRNWELITPLWSVSMMEHGNKADMKRVEFDLARAIYSALKGGKGSGFHGHAGRPGKVGGSAHISARFGLPLQPFPKKVDNATKEGMAGFKNACKTLVDYPNRRNRERGLVLDLSTGKISLDKLGTKDEVAWTDDEINMAVAGGFILHNHPSIYTPGDYAMTHTRLSGMDILFAAESRSKGILAISNANEVTMLEIDREAMFKAGVSTKLLMSELNSHDMNADRGLFDIARYIKSEYSGYLFSIMRCTHLILPMVSESLPRETLTRRLSPQ